MSILILSRAEHEREFYNLESSSAVQKINVNLSDRVASGISENCIECLYVGNLLRLIDKLKEWHLSITRKWTDAFYLVLYSMFGA